MEGSPLCTWLVEQKWATFGQWNGVRQQQGHGSSISAGVLPGVLLLSGGWPGAWLYDATRLPAANSGHGAQLRKSGAAVAGVACAALIGRPWAARAWVLSDAWAASGAQGARVHSRGLVAATGGPAHRQAGGGSCALCWLLVLMERWNGLAWHCATPVQQPATSKGGMPLQHCYCFHVRLRGQGLHR